MPLKSLKTSHWIAISILAGVMITLFYPRNEILVPEMRITVRYAGGELVSNGEVSRSWNHYLGDGWTASVAKTDLNGNVKFPQVTGRVPLIASTFWGFAGPFLNYYPGLAGDIKARDANNHYIWQRIDFNDRNCCPSEITISLHAEEGEGSDSYFAFGNVESAP